MLRAILTVEPPEVTHFNPLVPEEVAVIVRNMLQKDVSKRYETIGQARQELERLVSERTEALQDANLALHTQSLRDPLTGLANRRFLDATVSGTAAALLRRVLVEGPSHAAENGYLVFLIVDLDHFKEVNDRHGHPAGDRVLIQTAERLRAAVRDGDHVIRWGGEEFVVVAADAAPAATAGLAERIRTAIGGRPFDLPDGQRLTRTCSLGFAAYPFLPGFPDILSWYDVLTLADKCLYRAKEAGRNQWFGLLPPDGEPPSGLPDRDDLLAASLDELVEDGHACLERGPEAPTSGAPPAAR